MPQAQQNPDLEFLVLAEDLPVDGALGHARRVEQIRRIQFLLRLFFVVVEPHIAEAAEQDRDVPATDRLLDFDRPNQGFVAKVLGSAQFHVGQDQVSALLQPGNVADDVVQRRGKYRGGRTPGGLVRGRCGQWARRGIACRLCFRRARLCSSR